MQMKQLAALDSGREAGCRLHAFYVAILGERRDWISSLGSFPSARTGFSLGATGDGVAPMNGHLPSCTVRFACYIRTGRLPAFVGSE